jgi:hypothetical protein
MDVFYFVGKNDNSIPVKKFKSLSEAEAEIAALEKIDPEGVHNGDYYLDPPGDD